MKSAICTTRQGTSEVIAALLIMGVVAGVSFLALSSSAKQVISNQRSVNEILDDKNSQIQELLSIINYTVDSGKINLELFNYGVQEIKISRILVDGTDANYTIYLQDGTPTNTIPQKTLITLEVSNAGKSIQIITSTGNLIDMPLI